MNLPILRRARLALALLAGLLATTVICPAAPPAAAPVVRPLDPRTISDIARVLAGMRPLNDPQFNSYITTSTWINHSAFFDEAWMKLEKRRLSAIRAWSQTAMGGGGGAPVFYMFSGPDLLYVSNVFPRAKCYIMSGLEPVGVVPNIAVMTPDTFAGGLRTLQMALNSALNYSFFITKDMKGDLERSSFQGTVPVILTFLARSGGTVTDFNYVDIGPDGSLRRYGNASPGGGAPGVEIEFHRPGSGDQTVYYFRTNLSDGTFRPGSAFYNFCAKQGAGNAFVKAASYLMHEDSFSNVRNFLLKQSERIVQDDSGIPIRYFNPQSWNVTLYGHYVGPIDLFSNKYQRDLAAMYGDATKVQPIDFGVGYRFNASQSALILATRK